MTKNDYLLKWIDEGEPTDALSTLFAYNTDLMKAFNLSTAMFVSDKTLNYYTHDKILKQLSKDNPRDSWYFDVFGVDWSTPIELAKEKLSPRYVLQGNMEPTRLYSKKAIDEGVDKILSTMKGAPHIFNLGHGILPDVPVENAKYFIKAVQTRSAR